MTAYVETMRALSRCGDGWHSPVDVKRKAFGVNTKDLMDSLNNAGAIGHADWFCDDRHTKFSISRSGRAWLETKVRPHCGTCGHWVMRQDLAGLGLCSAPLPYWANSAPVSPSEMEARALDCACYLQVQR